MHTFVGGKGAINTREDWDEMPLECLDGPFSIVALVDVRLHESDVASVAAYGWFEFTRSFVVEYMPIHMESLGIFWMMVNVSVGIDRSVVLWDFQCNCQWVQEPSWGTCDPAKKWWESIQFGRHTWSFWWHQRCIGKHYGVWCLAVQQGVICQLWVWWSKCLVWFVSCDLFESCQVWENVWQHWQPWVWGMWWGCNVISLTVVWLWLGNPVHCMFCQRKVADVVDAIRSMAVGVARGVEEW